MPPSPPLWQITFARIEGALPFLSQEIAECLALRSLRRLWHAHVSSYVFDNLGPEHNPGPESHELVRTWHAEERRQFLSWISRRARPPLAKAARQVLAAKSQAEGFTTAFEPADNALARLDALLPSSDAIGTLLEWLDELRTDELDFLEGGSELVQAGKILITRPAPRAGAWAASLAAAMRPHLFGLGSAPLAFAGIMPRALFRERPESPLPLLLRAALQNASARAEEDLRALHNATILGDKKLAGLYASSNTPRAWRMIASLGPLTRSELARGLSVTKRTASQSVGVLQTAGLVILRPSDRAILPASADPTLRG
jgi:DNA-binding transcriptional ArsR family regulator